MRAAGGPACSPASEPAARYQPRHAYSPVPSEHDAEAFLQWRQQRAALDFALAAYGDLDRRHRPAHLELVSR
jgi:hypothetical protein